MFLTRAWFVVVVLIGAVASRADAPQQGTTPFVSEQQAYQVNYPSKWRRINPQKIGGAELSLTPDAETIKTRFTIMYFKDNGDGKQESNQEIEQFLLAPLKQAGDAKIESSGDTKLDHQPARTVKISVQPKADGAKPMIEHAIYCIHDNALYILVIAGPTQSMGEHEIGFGQIVDSFHFTK
jgi:hypothetical protein